MSVVQTGSYRSSSLGREQPYAWIAPVTNEPCSALFLLHGRSSDYLDWSRNTRVAEYVRAYRMLVIFPDGGDGWYTNGLDGDRREDDLVIDLAAHVQSTFNVKPPGRAWAVGGLSMGGYGALKLALKQTSIFATGFSHGGSLTITRLPDAYKVFGDQTNDVKFRRHEDLIWLAEQALCRLPAKRPRLHIDCGLSDRWLEANRQIHDHLEFLGCAHTYAEAAGHHTWPYWNRALRNILPTIAAEIGAEKIPIQGQN